MNWLNFSEPPETMDIHSKEGAKVVFEYPDNGYEYDKERALKLLRVGGIYTVACTNVYQSSTEVFLKEIKGVSFNSVLFKNLEEKQTENDK